MALTKVSRGLLSTGIVDNSNATAITLNADESATFASSVTANPSGGVVTLGTSGHLTSKQSLDVATAGGRFIGSSNRGVLGQIRIEQTANSTDGGYIAFDTSPSGSTSPQERMRIDGATGSVGIGKTPLGNNLSPALEMESGGTMFGYGDAMYLTGNLYYNGGWKAVATGAGASIILDGTGPKFYTNASASAGATVTPVERMRINESGHVGIAVVPYAWRTAYADKVLDLGTHSALYDQFGGSTFLVNNFYRSSNGDFKYKTTAGVTAITLDAGSVGFLTGPSGTAGATATLTNRMTIDSSGDVSMPYKAYAYGRIAGNPSNITNQYGIALTTTSYQNCTVQTNSTHGPGITITKAGFYTLYMSLLYDPVGNYVYLGWCVNGVQIQHWHSAHTVSNHDAVSSIGRYLNVGDHVTIENNSQDISTIYGNNHSSWYICKIG